jgi:UDP-N-acetylmuramoyl-L-alanyl-D-glutamate--2,6-diaminopimelate ligase
VFGCGGNRDTEKRPLMAAISEKLADYTIITTDNPRFEDPYKIAEDICRGFTKHKWLVQLDRGQALR